MEAEHLNFLLTSVFTSGLPPAQLVDYMAQLDESLNQQMAAGRQKCAQQIASKMLEKEVGDERRAAKAAGRLKQWEQKFREQEFREIERKSQRGVEEWATDVRIALRRYLQDEEPEAFEQVGEGLLPWLKGEGWVPADATAPRSRSAPAALPVDGGWVRASASDVAYIESGPWWVGFWVAAGCNKGRKQKVAAAGKKQSTGAEGLEQSQESEQQLPPLWQLPLIERWKLVDQWLGECGLWCLGMMINKDPVIGDVLHLLVQSMIVWALI